MILNKTLYTCILFLIFSQLYAQKDTTSNLSPIDSIDAAYERKTKEMEPNFERKSGNKKQFFNFERTLIKTGLYRQFYIVSPPFKEQQTLISGTVGIEKKIKNAFSLGVDCNYLPYYKLEPGIINVSTVIKYYYRMNNNIKNGKGANNFHGNYLFLGFEDLLRWEKNYGNGGYSGYGAYYTYSGIYNSYYSGMFFSISPFVSLGWGLQRRFGKFGYLDFKTILKFNEENYYLGLKLSLGLGLGLKK